MNNPYQEHIQLYQMQKPLQYSAHGDSQPLYNDSKINAHSTQSVGDYDQAYPPSHASSRNPILQHTDTSYSNDPPPGDAAPPLPFQGPPPERLRSDRRMRVPRLIFDIFLALLANMFAVFGIVCSIYHGHDSTDSVPQKLLRISQIAPTIFPILFAAVVGSSAKAIALWRVQSRHGASFCFLEQCYGSQSISRAFMTQWELRACNLMGVFLIAIWCMSPVGSQASLRVVSAGNDHEITEYMIHTMDSFQPYDYGFADGVSEALTSIRTPLATSMMTAALLATRNQDLWNNVRFPAVPDKSEATPDADGWIDLSSTPTTNLTYPSLVGMPLDGVSPLGPTSLSINGSYLSISCPFFEVTNQTSLTNYTDTNAPKPTNGDDCQWQMANKIGPYQMAISTPCNLSAMAYKNASISRAPRQLVWESRSADTSYTRALCDLTTTYVQTNFTCIGGIANCSATAVRQTASPSGLNANWTVFDTGEWHDSGGVLEIISNLFPNAATSGGLDPVIAYMSFPFHPVGNYLLSSFDVPVHRVGRVVFARRLEQVLNTALYLGISPASITGLFNITDPYVPGIMEKSATTYISWPVLRCHRNFLALLLLASLPAGILGIIGAIFWYRTRVPDVLGTTALAFLPNQLQAVQGQSTWTVGQWSKHIGQQRLFFGDIQPHLDVGSVALTTLDGRRPLSQLHKGRPYQ